MKTPKGKRPSRVRELRLYVGTRKAATADTCDEAGIYVGTISGAIRRS